jgi:hypothetical protein
MDWSDFIQSIGEKAVDIYAAKETADRTYDIEKLRLTQSLTPVTPATALGGLSQSTLLLLGVGVVGVVVVLSMKG